MEKLPVEQLTRERITIDLRWEYRGQLGVWGVFTALTAVFSLIFLVALQPVEDIVVLLGILGVLGAFLFALGSLIYYCRRYVVCGRTYRVVTDRLAWSGVATHSQPRLGGGIDAYHVFRFETYGRFYVDRASWGKTRELYTWSRWHHMFSDQLLKESTVDDEFYLVIDGKEIRCVYSTKLFRLAEE